MRTSSPGGGGGQGTRSGMGDPLAPRPLPCSLPGTLRPSGPPPHTPKLSSTPRGRGSVPPGPWDGLNLCFSKTGPPALGGAPGTLSHSQGAPRRVEFLLWDSCSPPHACSFSHCDFAPCPRGLGVGREHPRKHGSGQGLASLTLRDSCGQEGRGVCSLPRPLFLLPPLVPRRPGCS